MHHHMIENASKRISGVLGGDGILNGFADGDPEASGRIWVLLENLSSCIGIFAWAGDTVCSPGVHHETTIRFLIITDPHHIDLTLQSKETTSKTEGASPLASAGLCRDSFDPKNFVVIGLRNGCVGFVTSRRAHPFILVIKDRKSTRLNSS